MRSLKPNRPVIVLKAGLLAVPRPSIILALALTPTYFWDAPIITEGKPRVIIVLASPLLPTLMYFCRTNLHIRDLVVGGAIGFSHGVNGTSPGTSPLMSRLYNTNRVLSNSPSRVAGELEDQGA